MLIPLLSMYSGLVGSLVSDVGGPFKLFSPECSFLLLSQPAVYREPYSLLLCVRGLAWPF